MRVRIRIHSCVHSHLPRRRISEIIKADRLKHSPARSLIGVCCCYLTERASCMFTFPTLFGARRQGLLCARIPDDFRVQASEYPPDWLLLTSCPLCVEPGVGCCPLHPCDRRLRRRCLAAAQLATTVAAKAIRWSLVHGGPSVARGLPSTSPARSPRILAACASTALASNRWTCQPRSCAHSASTWQNMTESAAARAQRATSPRRRRPRR